MPALAGGVVATAVETVVASITWTSVLDGYIKISMCYFSYFQSELLSRASQLFTNPSPLTNYWHSFIAIAKDLILSVDGRTFFHSAVPVNLKSSVFLSFHFQPVPCPAGTPLANIPL